MAKIDALFTKSSTFLIWILSFPPPPDWAFWKIYTPGNFNKSPGTRAEADSRASTEYSNWVCTEYLHISSVIWDQWWWAEKWVVVVVVVCNSCSNKGILFSLWSYLVWYGPPPSPYLVDVWIQSCLITKLLMHKLSSLGMHILCNNCMW